MSSYFSGIIHNKSCFINQSASLCCGYARKTYGNDSDLIIFGGSFNDSLLFSEEIIRGYNEMGRC
jgi:hypothetical protein